MEFSINDVKIETARNKIKTSEFKKLVQLWVRDYRIQGDVCADVNQIYRSILENFSETTLIAYYNGALVGFVCVCKGEVSRVIELAYSVPSLRGKGVATKLYIAAIERFGADEIEVNFKRAKSKVEYWQSLGFKSCKKRYGQAYSMKAICYLSLKEASHNVLAFPLERKEIQEYLRTQGGNASINAGKLVPFQQPNVLEECPTTYSSNLDTSPKNNLPAVYR